MARSSVIQPVSQGGLGIVDIAKKILSLRAVGFVVFSVTHHILGQFHCDHVASAFYGHTIQQVLGRDRIPAYLIKKLSSFYRGILEAWVQLRGKSIADAWVIPRPAGQFIEVTALTARDGYSLLRRSSWVEHRSVSTFRDLGLSVNWSTTWSSLHSWRFQHGRRADIEEDRHGDVTESGHLISLALVFSLVLWRGGLGLDGSDFSRCQGSSSYFIRRCSAHGRTDCFETHP